MTRGEFERLGPGERTVKITSGFTVTD